MALGIGLYLSGEDRVTAMADYEEIDDLEESLIDAILREIPSIQEIRVSQRVYILANHNSMKLMYP